ncbi:MAG: glutamate mutase L [Actinomycetota bacterium]|nr:glutamate mutase L [Actinomycetota bacterium]
MRGWVACVDFGSTFTKALLVDVEADPGAVLACASHPTTIDTDVLDGWSACLEQLETACPGARHTPVRACSSAGGGLRVAVVGNEELVTAEAGRRVALSSGGTVVHVGCRGLAAPFAIEELVAGRPDVVLLVGGTDGGNGEVLVGAARRLGDVHWEVPVVVAGNMDAAPLAAVLLAQAGVEHVVAANVVPQIGVLSPAGARAAIRDTFLAHVIGGKRLSASAAFLDMVRGPTPDIVLTGVELLARGLGPAQPGVGDVVVVDVGGATTDVYSVVDLDPEEGALSREVVPATPVTRTVEGDLGVRWSALTTIERGAEAGLVDAGERDGLHEAARARGISPGLLPGTEREQADDERLAGLALEMALRRHAGRQRVIFGPGGRLVERDGTDLREVDLLVGSGGVLRHAEPSAGQRVVRTATGDPVPGGWLLPRSPRVVIERTYVLAAAGLLRGEHPYSAHRLLRRYLAS